MIQNLNDVDETTINTLRVLDVLNRYRAKGDLSPRISSVLKEAFDKSKAVGPQLPTTTGTDDANTQRLNLNVYNRDKSK